MLILMVALSKNPVMNMHSPSTRRFENSQITGKFVSALMVMVFGMDLLTLMAMDYMIMGLMWEKILIEMVFLTKVKRILRIEIPMMMV
jgi:hypothetical protein